MMRRQHEWVVVRLALLGGILTSCGARTIASSGPASDDGAGGSRGTRTSTSTRGSGGTDPSPGTGGAATSSARNTGATPSVTVVTTSAVSTSTTGAISNVDIPFRDGWAPLEQNQYGIQGAFWVAADLGGSVAAGSFDDASCIRGAVARVTVGPNGNLDFGYYWGAMLGFNLSQGSDSGPARSYDATAHGVIGFGFVVGGNNPVPPGGELRINVKVYGDDSIYCNRVIGNGPTAYTFASIHQNCWEGDSTAPTPDPSRIESLQWQYATNLDRSYDFDLCIEQLWVIPG